MSETRLYNPQQTFLYRLIALLTRFQLGYLLRVARNPRLVVMLFLFVAGATAIGIITLVAYLTKLPLLFPPLGPSAFVLFHTPMSERASPRNVVLSHSMGIVAGLLSLRLMAGLFPEAGILDPAVMNWPRVLAIAMSMGLVSVVMISARCAHPPAAATALLGAMGFLENITQVVGLLAAVVLLVLEAFLLNRLVGGLPYPLWRADPKISRRYGSLAGVPDLGSPFWQQLESRIFRARRS